MKKKNDYVMDVDLGEVYPAVEAVLLPGHHHAADPPPGGCN
jgi:hypothetical protein